MSCLFAKFVQKKKSTTLNILLNDNENVYRGTLFSLIRPLRTSKGNGIKVVPEILYCIFNSYHLLQSTQNLGWENYYTDKIKK